MGCGPGGPAGPRGPGGPAGPAGPVAPTGPAGPAIPGSPLSPLSPFAPAGPGGPGGPSKHPPTARAVPITIIVSSFFMRVLSTAVSLARQLADVEEIDGAGMIVATRLEPRSVSREPRSPAWPPSYSMSRSNRPTPRSLPGLTRQSIHFAKCSCERGMDPRVKPAGDAGGGRALNQATGTCSSSTPWLARPAPACRDSDRGTAA